MASVLVIDPAQKSRRRVFKLMTGAAYRVFIAEDPGMSEPMIRSLDPDIILINRRASDFDAVALFMQIRERFPDKPALLYALESRTALESFHQAVNMALFEKRKLFGRARHLPA